MDDGRSLVSTNCSAMEIAVELALDGIKYTIETEQRYPGFSAKWSCPACKVTGRLGISDGTIEDVLQLASDRVRKHHAEKHAKA